MSHNIDYTTYDLNVNKGEVWAEWNEVARAANYPHCSGGLYTEIEWKNDRVFNSYDEAVAWIEKNEKYNYWQVAVKYREYPKLIKSKGLEKAEQQLADTQIKWRKLDTVKYRDTVSSAYIGCKKCGSKLSRQYVSSNYCPLCREDLRSETTRNQLKKLKENIEKYRLVVKAEEDKCRKKQFDKAVVKWLVKTEYHT